MPFCRSSLPICRLGLTQAVHDEHSIFVYLIYYNLSVQLLLSRLDLIFLLSFDAISKREEFSFNSHTGSIRFPFLRSRLFYFLCKYCKKYLLKQKVVCKLIFPRENSGSELVQMQSHQARLATLAQGFFYELNSCLPFSSVELFRSLNFSVWSAVELKEER